MENRKKLKTALQKHINERVEGIGVTQKKDGLFFSKKAGESNREFVRRVFCGDLPEQHFNDLYDQAIGGSGNEDCNMDNAISSALFPFLFFSRVSEKNPITIDGTEYTHVCFEFKNRTLSGKSDFAPSNIDVVLASIDYKDILFIESKFGEYFYSLTSAATEYKGLSIQYAQKGSTVPIIAGILSGNRLHLKKNDNELVFKDDNEPHYFEGIKQMLTHISGISNYVEGEGYFYSKNYAHLYDGIKKQFEEAHKATVALLEIVFDFSERFGFGKEAYNGYDTLHDSLLDAVDKHELGFDVKRLFTYQKIVEENPGYLSSLPKIVRDVYKLDP